MSAEEARSAPPANLIQTSGFLPGRAQFDRAAPNATSEAPAATPTEASSSRADGWGGIAMLAHCAQSVETHTHSGGSNDPDREDVSYSRKDKSLGLLCDKFLQEYSQASEVCLDASAKRLGVERRRIYDIVNVLESVEVVHKKAKNRYAWYGTSRMATSLHKLKMMGNPDEDKSDGVNSDDSDEQLKPHALGSAAPLPGAPASARKSTGSRREKSLGVLSQKFVRLFLNAPDGVLSLESAAKRLMDDGVVAMDEGQLKTKIRRLYDIANILCSLGLIEKTHLEYGSRKPAFKWRFAVKDSEFGGAESEEGARACLDAKRNLGEVGGSLASNPAKRGRLSGGGKSDSGKSSQSGHGGSGLYARTAMPSFEGMFPQFPFQFVDMANSMAVVMASLGANATGIPGMPGLPGMPVVHGMPAVPAVKPEGAAGANGGAPATSQAEPAGGAAAAAAASGAAPPGPPAAPAAPPPATSTAPASGTAAPVMPNAGMQAYMQYFTQMAGMHSLMAHFANSAGAGQSAIPAVPPMDPAMQQYMQMMWAMMGQHVNAANPAFQPPGVNTAALPKATLVEPSTGQDEAGKAKADTEIVKADVVRTDASRGTDPVVSAEVIQAEPVLRAELLEAKVVGASTESGGAASAEGGGGDKKAADTA